MFSNIQKPSFIFGGILAYPLLIIFVMFLDEPKTVLLAGLFAGVNFIIISHMMGRALGFFYVPYYRDSEPDKYWFWMGHYFGFVFWCLISLILGFPISY